MKIPPRPLSILLFALAAIAGPMIRGAVTPPIEVEGPTVELPKFEVSDSRLLPLPESWHYAEIPGFEILSNISERETRRFTQDFLLLQEVINVIMPALNRGRPAMPTSLILCGGAHGASQFVPTERRDDEYGANSMFFDSPERTAIVMDFALSELQIDSSTIVESDPYRAFYAAYFRHLLRRQMGHTSPPWLEEGLVRLFGGIDFTNKWINFGMVGNGFGAEKTGDFNRFLTGRHMMPLAEMFASEGKGNSAWGYQCYAFVHMCLYSVGHKLQKPFIEFCSHLGDEQPSEELFQRCFHKSYKQMEVELRGYIDFTAFTYVEFNAKKGHKLPDPPPVILRDATQSEVGRIKGEVLQMGGHADSAHLELIAPYIRGERDPRLLAALGLDEQLTGHDDRARKFLEAAARAKAVRPRAYLELARLRYSDAIAKPAAPNGKLSEAQLATVLEPLATARTQRPPMADVYALQASAWAHSAVQPTREQFAGVIEGVRQFPADPNLLMQAILLASEAGFNDDARKLADHAVRVFASNPTERERFQLLASALQRDTAVPASPAPADRTTK
jgi:hypothetical protein